MANTYSDEYNGPLLNPLADPIFKILFTDPSKEANIALTSFLSCIFNRKVENVEIVSNELSKESTSDRAAVFDISCKFVDDNEVIEIEMQGRDDHNAYDKRAEYYAAHLLNHYSKCGEGWVDVPRAYQISVLNFIYDKNDDSGFSHYVMRKESGGTLSKRLNIFFIELPKLMCDPDVDIEKLTSIEKWSNFLLYANDKDEQMFVNKIAESEEGIMNAQKILNRISQDEINWQRERDFFDQKMTLETIKRYARETGYSEGLKMGKIDGMKKGKKEGLAEGRAEGRAEGIAEGRAEGIAEGRAEGIEENAINTAKNMLKDNLPAEKIAMYTGLSLEKVLELKERKE